jgi:ribonuclease P protein component
MHSSARNTLRKKDRLSGRKAIQSLFEKGRSFTVFPLRIVWTPAAEEASLQAGFGVSARYFKKAVDRNRIKRLLKEAYRLQKAPLTEVIVASGKKLSLFIHFMGNEIPSYEMVFDSMGKAIKKMKDLIHESDQRNT